MGIGTGREKQEGKGMNGVGEVERVLNPMMMTRQPTTTTHLHFDFIFYLFQFVIY